jgi:hypothetical protein
MSQYVVPNMTLIPQDLNNACWWASASMLSLWRNRFRDPFQMDHPALRNNVVRTHRAHNGLQWSTMRSFALQLGLVPIPRLDHAPTAAELMGWLRRYGPLWANGLPLNRDGNAVGMGHVVVFAGARDTPTEDVLIYDPWPPPHPPNDRGGRIYWRPIGSLAVMFVAQLAVSRDAVSVLHLP